MGHQYEIEIKSLLGERKNADSFRSRLMEKGAVLVSSGKQLNHYFVGNDLTKFHQNLLPLVPEEKKELFVKIVTSGNNFSIRTRQTDEKVLLVIKASIDDGSSANSVSRMEFEVEIIGKTLEELDKIILDSGLAYQAKWSRAREEYKLEVTMVTIDKNAGYGYLAEFEKVISEEGKKDEVKKELKNLMEVLGVEELPQDRLERMFAHYNQNWQDYYGTDKVFTII